MEAEILFPEAATDYDIQTVQYGDTSLLVR